jgi:hypothetical protein
MIFINKPGDPDRMISGIMLRNKEIELFYT